MIHGRRVLITGGGGFIGAALAETLHPSNEILLYDIRFDQNSAAYANLKDKPNIRFIQGDILDKRRLREACRDAHIVVHLASVVGVQTVIMNALRTLEVNVQGVQNILEILNPSTTERFVYISSSEIYGPDAYNAGESDNAVSGPPDDPRWSYAASKIVGEHMTQGHYQERGLPAVIVRPFNLFGPKRIGDHAVMRFIFQALNHDPITVHNDGSAIRSWCYIDDFIDGLLRAATAEEAVGQAFNIGNPANTVTMLQLARAVIQACNSSSRIEFVPFKHSDVHLRSPNISRARSVLGYEPKACLDEALLETARWYRQHAAQIAPRLLAP